MMRIHVFTSAAANYLPKVRALFASLRRIRPQWRLHLALADASERAPAGWDADIHTLEDLAIPDWRGWAFCHSLIELATAIKPFALKRILERDDCDAAIYLDPDVVVFSDLADVVAALGNADIVLTPHQTAPEPTLRGVVRHEICTLQHGIYNLGFIGVAAREEGLAFADWWARRAYAFCREDIPSGLYTDQRWVDLVPAYFDAVRILRGGHLNLAPWNVATRSVTATGDGVRVDGRPLGFVHFSAVDSGGCAAFEADPVLSGRLAAYRLEIGAGDEEPAWGLGSFRDGEPILMEQRLVFRLRGDLYRAYPDPFASGPETFQAWWRAEARNEFPALFDPAARPGELARLSSALTTAFADIQGAARTG